MLKDKIQAVRQNMYKIQLTQINNIQGLRCLPYCDNCQKENVAQHVLHGSSGLEKFLSFFFYFTLRTPN